MLMIPLVFFMIGGSTMAVVMALDIVSLIMMGIQIAYLLLHPEVLYGDGFQALIPRVPEGSGNLTVSIAEKSRPAQAAEKAGLLTDRLDDHMAMNKPYLKQGYKLRDLADEIDVPMTRLSAHINHVHGTNFSGYVNELRIEHAISKMRDHAHRNKTLEAIAEESGFQNRITFIRAFKRSKGVTPSRFMDTDRLG